MRRIVCAGVLLLSIVCVARVAAAQTREARGANKTKSEETGAAAIRGVLDRQVAAWNRGDIDGFMDGYARSDDTTFVSGDAVTRGWRTVLERYKRRYDSREKMGTLAFTELETRTLAADTALVTGRWQLARAAGQKPFARGRFTLVFRRTADGWRVVYDHTSAAE